MGAPGLTGISIPGALTCVTFSSLFAHFEPFGFTKRGFRSYLSALGVKLHHLPKGESLVDLHQFALGFKIATRIAGDFYAPGHPAIRKQKLPKYAVTRLTPELIEQHWSQVLLELEASNRLAGIETFPELRDAYVTAKRSIIDELVRRTLNPNG